MYSIGSVADNGARGCGHLQEGGFYASSTMSADGELKAWTWLVSSAFQHPANSGGQVLPHNYNLVCPPRSMQVINLQGSLSYGATMTDPGFAPDEPFEANLERLPAYALLDHVGADYSPFYFALECRMRGPNRRIPETLAKKLAQYLAKLHALPIVFTHNAILRAPDYKAIVAVLTNEELMAALSAEPVESSVDDSSHLPLFYPSHWRKGFGFTIFDDWLADNPVLPETILHRLMHKWLSEYPGGARRPQEVIPAEYLEAGWGVREGGFGVSWITQAIYVCPKGTKAEEQTELIQAGIVPVYAGDPEGESAGITDDLLEFAPQEDVTL